MIRLFFDTETNGLPKGNRPPADYPEIYPLEIAAVLENSENNRRQYLVGLLDWSHHGQQPTIPPEVTAINGIEQSHLTSGLHPRSALELFGKMLASADQVIAHNLSFDWRIFEIWASKFTEGGIDYLRPRSEFCTMEASTELCRLPSPRGGFKWPKLQELHQFLFGKPFEGAHGALADTLAMRRCFFELQARGIAP